MNSDPAELASNLDNGSLESAAESESYGTSDVTARAAPTESLIDAIVAASGEQSGGRRQSDRLERFLADESLGALSEWFGRERKRVV